MDGIIPIHAREAIVVRYRGSEASDGDLFMRIKPHARDRQRVTLSKRGVAHAPPASKLYVNRFFLKIEMKIKINYIKETLSLLINKMIKFRKLF